MRPRTVSFIDALWNQRLAAVWVMASLSGSGEPGIGAFYVLSKNAGTRVDEMDGFARHSFPFLVPCRIQLDVTS